MKRTNESSYLVELVLKTCLIAAVATALLVPTTIRVHGSDIAPRLETARPMLKQASWDALPLPPIPYLETMPWLGRERLPKGFRIDMLLAPEFQMMTPAVADTRSNGLVSSALDSSRKG
jgi:hypothetical protein